MNNTKQVIRKTLAVIEWTGKAIDMLLIALVVLGGLFLLARTPVPPTGDSNGGPATVYLHTTTGRG